MGAALQTLTYEGHDLRVLEHGTTRAIPVNDLADAAGRSRESLRAMIQRDELLQEWSTTNVTLAVDGKAREVLCLTEPGVIRLLGMLNPERSATPESRAKVLAFGRWAATTLVSVLHNGAPALSSTPMPPALPDLQSQITELRTMLESRAVKIAPSPETIEKLQGAELALWGARNLMDQALKSLHGTLRVMEVKSMLHPSHFKNQN